MAGGVETFIWRRDEGGYEWIDGESLNQRMEGIPAVRQDTRFLVSRDDGGRALIYNPLSAHPALFREFAALHVTQETAEEAFAGFANRFGQLGVDEFLAGSSGVVQTGEPLSRWSVEWSRMNAVVHVLDAIESHDLARLEELVILTQDRARIEVRLPRHESFGEVANPDDHRTWLWKHAWAAPDRPERLARFARGWVQNRINEYLDGRRQGSTASARVLFNSQRQAFTIHLVPVSLLAAMWLQCARMLTTTVSLRACEQCGKWFELSPDARRRQTKYCSARCRVAAYRARVAQRPAADRASSR